MRIGNTKIKAGASPSGPPRAFDADVLAWETQVIANGGTVSLQQRIIVDQFVFNEKAAGIWALTDDYWQLWGENSIQARTSLKQKRLATPVNSPSFAGGQGFTCDGATSYLNSGFIPGTHAVAMLNNSAHIQVYSRTNANSGYDIGCSTSSSTNSGIRARSTSTFTGNHNSTSTAGQANASSLGSFTMTRTGDIFEEYANGVSIGQYVPTVIGAGALVNIAYFIGGLNNNGAYQTGSIHQLGFAAVGGALNAAQVLNRYNNLVAFGTSVGAI